MRFHWCLLQECSLLNEVSSKAGVGGLVDYNDSDVRQNRQGFGETEIYDSINNTAGYNVFTNTKDS